MAEPANNPIKLSVRVVTPRAGHASRHRSHAGYRARWTDEKRPEHFFSEQRSQQLPTKNGSGAAAALTAAEIG